MIRKKIFITCTYRAGSNFLCQRLNTHTNILIIPDKMHFFRFIYRPEIKLSRPKIEEIVRNFCRRFLLCVRIDVASIEKEKMARAKTNEKRVFTRSDCYDQMNGL
jgi:hypothetical protein